MGADEVSLVQGAIMLPAAMLPDVIEVDQLASGHRQEGAYAGVTIFAGKLGQMSILALLPVMLRWSGYIQPGPENPSPVQPDSVLFILRLLIAILPALLLGISIIVAYFYPITRNRHAEIRRKLQNSSLSGRCNNEPPPSVISSNQ